MKNEVFIIGINGSPRKNGKTVMMVKRVLKSVNKHGGKTELIHLIDKEIKPCLGCYSNSPGLCTYPCKQKDDMQTLCNKLIKADGMVLGSPIYWFNMSGLTKNFIDRLTCTATGGYLLEGRVGVFISTSKENEGGRALAVLNMAGALNHLGFLIPPYGTMFYPGKEEMSVKGKIVWDNWALKDSERIGASIVQLCKFLKKEKLNW